MKSLLWKSVMTLAAIVFCMLPAFADGSSRQERRTILDGNRLFNEGKFSAAAKKYQDALKINPASAVGKYNLGLSQIKQVSNPKDTTARNKELLRKANENLSAVAGLGAQKPSLASKANYNLGNLSFNMEDYGSAINFYKQALRLDPNSDKARKNLRIAQLKQQNQNKDKNKDQNKDQDKNKDQNKDKDKNKDQNKDQNKDNQQNQDKQQQQQPNQMNQQTADQILQALENKEAATRAKFNASKAEKSTGNGRSRKNW